MTVSQFENSAGLYQLLLVRVKRSYHRLLDGYGNPIRMSDIHQRLKEARIAAGFPSAAAAAHSMGISYQTYAGHENGKAGVRTAQAERYARKFRVSLDWLVSNRGEMRPNTSLLAYNEAFGLPVLGAIRAGYWLDTSARDEDESETKRIPVLPDERYQGRQYALRVEGDSLDKIVPDGAYVTCVDYADSGLDLTPGIIAHVERRMNGGQLVEITLKKVERHNGKWRLVPQSSNPKWQPIELEGDGENDDPTSEVVVRGIALGTYRPLI